MTRLFSKLRLEMSKTHKNRHLKQIMKMIFFWLRICYITVLVI